VQYQLVYSSKATNKMMLSHLIGILRKARINNKLSDVTGLLVFVDGMFLQVLEGEEGRVKGLMKKISADTRHHDIKVIRGSNVERRTFSNWEMAYTSPSTKILAMWSGLKGTRTVEEILTNLKNNPDIVPELMLHLSENILNSEQHL
jgi:hypothetical protein